ncbi:MAG: hypothetical protein ABI889_10960 [Gemmatimonadota bacterium]
MYNFPNFARIRHTVALTAMRDACMRADAAGDSASRTHAVSVAQVQAFGKTRGA